MAQADAEQAAAEQAALAQQEAAAAPAKKKKPKKKSESKPKKDDKAETKSHGVTVNVHVGGEKKSSDKKDSEKTASDAASFARMGAIAGALGGAAIGAGAADKGERKAGTLKGALRGGTLGALGGLTSGGMGDLQQYLKSRGKIRPDNYLLGQGSLAGLVVGTPASMAYVAHKAREKKAGTPFLKQDRSEKVKEIYSALKRDHPSMPAEMKARIAARQGKPGKQKQGPPYKGPITSEYTPSMQKRDERENKR